MKLLYGLGFGLIALIALKVLGEIVPALKPSEFLSGWLCCMAYYTKKYEL